MSSFPFKSYFERRIESGQAKPDFPFKNNRHQKMALSSEKEVDIRLNDEKEDNDKDLADFNLDENLAHLGVRGFYPSGLYLLLSFFVLITPMQYLSSHVSSFTPEHRCKIPAHLLANTSAATAPADADLSVTADAFAATDSRLELERDNSSITTSFSLSDVIPKLEMEGVEKFESCARFKNLEKLTVEGECALVKGSSGYSG